VFTPNEKVEDNISAAEFLGGRLETVYTELMAVGNGSWAMGREQWAMGRSLNILEKHQS